MSFLSYKVLLENSLYTNPIERANLVADKQKLMDALLINFFGFLGLYAISDKRGKMQHYSSEEKKLIPSMIGDENKDVSLVIRLALDAGILKQTGANHMTKLLALIKQKQVKADGIDNVKVREFVDSILYTAHPPTTYIKQAFNDFVDGKSDVAHLAKSFFEIVRTKRDYHPITVEFRALALTYRPYFDQLPDVVALTPGAVPHSHAADSLKNRIKKGQTRAPSGPVVASGNVPQPAAVVAAPTAKPKKTKVLSPPVPIAPVVVQGYTNEFFVEALNARGQKEINVVFKKFGVALPASANGTQEMFVRNYEQWKTLFHASLSSKTPAMPKLDINKCNEGAGKYLKKYDSRSYVLHLKFVWDSFSFHNSLEDTLALVDHTFDINYTGKKIIEKFGTNSLFWYKEEIINYVLDVLKNTQPTEQSVDASIKKLQPFEKYVDVFNARMAGIRNNSLFSSVVPADAVMTQFDFISHDPYNSLSRFGISTYSVQTVKMTDGGKTFVMSSMVFDKLDPTQKEIIKLLGDKLKIQTESDAQTVLDAIVSATPFTEVTMLSAVKSVANLKIKDLISSDMYNAALLKLFKANIVLASAAVRFNGAASIKEFISANLPSLANIIKSQPTLFGVEDFFKLTADTYKILPLVFSSHSQDDWLQFYIDNSNNWEVSGLINELGELLGTSYSPNNTLLQVAFDKSKKLFYQLWKSATTDQKINEKLVDLLSINDAGTDFFQQIRYSNVRGTSDTEPLAEFWNNLISTNSSLKNLFLKVIEETADMRIKGWILNDSSYDGIGFAVKCLGYIPDFLQKKIEDTWEQMLIAGNRKAVPKDKHSILVKVGEKVLTKVFDSSKTSFSTFDKLEMSKSIPKLAKKYLETLTENDVKTAIEADLTGVGPSGYSRTSSNWLKFVDVVKGLKDSEGCPSNLGKLANVAFRLARDNKKTFKKQFRDEFAEEVLGLMMSDVESKDAQTAFSELEDTLLKKRFLTQFINIELATKAQEELNKKDLAIVPQRPLSKTQVAAVLKLNNVDIPFDRSLVKSNDIKDVQRQVEAHTKKQGFQELAVKEVTRSTKELVAESIRLDQYNRHAHGETAFLVKKMFDVAIPRQTSGYPAWKTAHPNATEMLQFHGTASLPAAMIMRYGFTVVDQSVASAAGIKYTGKMLGDGVYCSNVIDKVGQYLGESGMTRRYGTMGYLFEMNALMDQWGRKVSKQSQNDFASAGTGRYGESYNTVSPEWAMRDAEQFNIHRCYHVEIISKNKMKELKEEYLKESFTHKKFEEFLKEAREEETNMKKISYCFVDGSIPVSKTEAKNFDEIDMSAFPNATLDFNRQGVVLQFDCPVDHEEFHETVMWTRVFMQDQDKLDLFFKLLKGK